MSENNTDSGITTGSITGNTYEPLSDEEIAKLAKAWYRNEVFFSFFIPVEQRMSMIHSIFMVLLFIDDIQRKHMVANEIDIFYEYISEAGPTSINGYPVFYSCRMMNRADGNRVIEKYKEIKELLGE